jgi:histidinol-phosphate aminotransferase
MPTSPRRSLADLRPYSPGKPIEEVQREFGIRDVVKLASNENPLGPSPKVVEVIRSLADRVHLYPDAGAKDLKEALSRYLNLPTAQISLGNGSDELIHYLGVAFLNMGDSVVAGDPSFVRYYAAAHLAGAELRLVPLDENARHDLAAMERAVDDTTRIVFLANPNNPTGTIVPRDQLAGFVERLQDRCVIVLDEAYHEFCESEEYLTSVELLQQGFRVIGLRTFSKTYALAGLRVGYLIGPTDWVDAIERVREPFNVNLLAQAAAIAALEDTDHLRQSVEGNRRGLRRLADILVRNGAKVAESHANFVWAEFPFETGGLCHALLRRGVVIRGGDIFGCPNCIRVSVGTDAELDRFEQALDEVMKESARA